MTAATKGLQLHGPWATSVLLPRGTRLRLGRHASNDVVVEHPSVSRFHAVLDWTAESPTVMDLGSANGTKVDGRAVPRDAAVALAPGCALRLGDVQLALHEAPASGATPSPTSRIGGPLKDGADLRRVLLTLEAARRSGELSVSLAGELEARLGLAEGRIVAASVGGAPEQDASGPRGADHESPAGASSPSARPASVLRRTHDTQQAATGLDAVERLLDAVPRAFRFAPDAEVARQPLRIVVSEYLARRDEDETPSLRATERRRRVDVD